MCGSAVTVCFALKRELKRFDDRPTRPRVHLVICHRRGELDGHAPIPQGVEAELQITVDPTQRGKPVEITLRCFALYVVVPARLDAVVGAEGDG